MTETAAPKIVLLAAPGRSTRILYHALANRGLDQVILEAPVPRYTFVRRRLRRLGLSKVVGQLLFRGAIVPLLHATSGARVRDILESSGLDDRPIPEERIVRVSSANAERTTKLLREIAPALVLLNGTRILKQDVLDCVPARFVNIHVGITPSYRGVHGGYWALVQDEPEACGVTVYFVDAGIDTGAIISQATIEPSERDNFTTYPLLQLARGISLLEDALPRLLRNEVVGTAAPERPSRLWTHPTFGEYLGNRIRLGVR